MMQIFRDPSLLSKIRRELDGALKPSLIPGTSFDVEMLIQLRGLQSVYCETLGLNVDAYVMRYTACADLRIREWTFPRNKIILVTTSPGHTDKTLLNTGKPGEYPVDKFWAERFLVFMNKNHSGPIRVSGKKPPVRAHQDFSPDRDLGTAVPPPSQHSLQQEQRVTGFPSVDAKGSVQGDALRKEES